MHMHVPRSDSGMHEWRMDSGMHEQQGAHMDSCMLGQGPMVESGVHGLAWPEDPTMFLS